MRQLFLLLCLCALSACKSTRTVLSGPQQVSTGQSDYSPERETQSRAAGAAASTAGVTGQFGSGGDAFNQKFGSFDPGGYIRKDPRNPKNTIYGLNSLSHKTFGGDTNTKDMKSFTQTRDFLAKRYSNTRELEQKESSSQGIRSWFSGRKANTDRAARETGAEYSGSGRTIANKVSSSDGRTVNSRTAREQERTAGTKDYYPAKKVLDEGRDAPKIIGEGDKATRDAVWKHIKSRPRDNPATVEEIRQLLGKTN